MITVNGYISKLKHQCYMEIIFYLWVKESYKNFYLFRSHVPLLHANKTLKVICTGKAFTSEEIHLFQKYSIFNQLIAIQANDSMLYSLYQNALVFVFPSLYEGFGIPILEAFANNCPVCLSNTSCFPEIAQDAAQYFDPTDKISILDSIQKVISNKEKRNDLISKGKEKIKYFSIKHHTL